MLSIISRWSNTRNLCTYSQISNSPTFNFMFTFEYILYADIQPLAGIAVSLDNITTFDKKTNSFNVSYYYCPVL